MERVHSRKANLFMPEGCEDSDAGTPERKERGGLQLRTAQQRHGTHSHAVTFAHDMSNHMWRAYA
jgi:hypothetical protein